MSIAKMERIQDATIARTIRKKKAQNKPLKCMLEFEKNGIIFPKQGKISAEDFLSLIKLQTEKKNDKEILVEILNTARKFNRSNIDGIIAYFSIRQERFSEKKLNYLIREFVPKWIDETYPEIRAAIPSVSFLSLIAIFREISQ